MVSASVHPLQQLRCYCPCVSLKPCQVKVHDFYREARRQAALVTGQVHQEMKEDAWATQGRASCVSQWFVYSRILNISGTRGHLCKATFEHKFSGTGASRNLPNTGALRGLLVVACMAWPNTKARGYQPPTPSRNVCRFGQTCMACLGLPATGPCTIRVHRDGRRFSSNSQRVVPKPVFVACPSAKTLQPPVTSAMLCA